MENSGIPKTHLKIRDRVLRLDKPVVMGILNITPDSFSDGGEFVSEEAALVRVGEMVSQGAAIIDIGGESTRPGADLVPEQEEIRRVLPVLAAAAELYPETFFSVDTTKYRVAEASLRAGAHIINDVSGLEKESRFAELCSQYGAGYVLMHAQGDPKTMQENPVYNNVVQEIGDFFEEKLTVLEQKGVRSVLIDPGIGFGKNLSHNLKIIAELHKFGKFNYPVLVGASRKSMIGQILDNRPATERLSGTLAIHYHSLINGASVLRVHDVKEAADIIGIFNALRSIQ